MNTSRITRIEVTGNDWKDNPTTNLIGREPYVIATSRPWYGHSAYLLQRRSDKRLFLVYPRGMTAGVLNDFESSATESL